MQASHLLRCKKCPNCITPPGNCGASEGRMEAAVAFELLPSGPHSAADASSSNSSPPMQCHFPHPCLQCKLFRVLERLSRSCTFIFTNIFDDVLSDTFRQRPNFNMNMGCSSAEFSRWRCISVLSTQAKFGAGWAE